MLKVIDRPNHLRYSLLRQNFGTWIGKTYWDIRVKYHRYFILSLIDIKRDIIICVISGIFCFVVCSTGGLVAQEASFQTYTDNDNGFTINYPTNWSLEKSYGMLTVSPTDAATLYRIISGPYSVSIKEGVMVFPPGPLVAKLWGCRSIYYPG